MIIVGPREKRVPLFAAGLSDLRRLEQGICDSKASAHTVSGTAATADEGNCAPATLRPLIPKRELTSEAVTENSRFDRTGFLYQVRRIMEKQAEAGDRVYRVVEVIGTSTQSWEDAAKNAVETAGKTLRDLRIAEVVKMDMKVEDGKVLAYRTRVLLSFKYES